MDISDDTTTTRTALLQAKMRDMKRDIETATRFHDNLRHADPPEPTYEQLRNDPDSQLRNATNAFCWGMGPVVVEASLTVTPSRVYRRIPVGDPPPPRSWWQRLLAFLNGRGAGGRGEA